MAAGEHTHGQLVTGAGSITATDTNIGQITLPAGGPWFISGIYGLAVAATLTAAEFSGGYIEPQVSSGDLSPNPAPGKYPTGFGGSILNTTGSCQVCPLYIHEVEWESPGKGVINMIFHQEIAATAASQVVCGLIYGRGPIEKKSARFIDRVATTKTAAAKSAIGTITLSEKAEEIVGVGFFLVQDGVITAGEELIGYGIIESDDLDIVPGMYPAACAFSAGIGATIGNPVYCPANLIPVNIPVVGGARVDCSCVLNTAVTNGAYVACYIAYR